jgi:hypothetical protein
MREPIPFFRLVDDASVPTALAGTARFSPGGLSGVGTEDGVTVFRF